MLSPGYFAPGYFSGSYFGTAGGDIVVTPPMPAFVDEPPLFCDPIYSDPYKGKVPTWYGGGWRTKLPVTRVGTPELEDFARSLDLDFANTQARCNFQQVRRIKAVIVPRSNATKNAQVQITLAIGDAALTGAYAHESAWLTPWPAWVSSDDAYGWPMPLVYFIDDALVGVDASHLLIKWKDAGNPDGYLEIPRVLATGVYVFPSSMSVGAEPLIPINDSEVWKSDGNTRVFNDIPEMRSASFEINRVEESEAYGAMAEMGRRLGASGQVFYCFGQHDPQMYRRAFLATRKPRGAQWKWSTELATVIELEEVL